MNWTYEVTLSFDEKIAIILALKSKVDQYAGFVTAFDGKEEYAKECEEAKVNLEKTAALLKKIEEVSAL